VPGLENDVAVQRKVFRIEESGAVAVRGTPRAAAREGTPREFIAELQALRALIEPRAPSRETMERCRAQLAEADAYKRELEQLYAAILKTRQADDATRSAGAAQMARVGQELTAIVAGTEQATQAILQAAEDIDQTAHMLSAALKNEHEHRLAQDIQDRVVQILESCNFQDLTGQRVANALAAMKTIEAHAARLMEIWHKLERFEPVVLEDVDADRRFLNGPKLNGEAGHSSQDDIDAIFGCA